MTVKDINNKDYTLTKSQFMNATRLAEAVTGLEGFYGQSLLVTSGIRTFQDQMRINPNAKNSAHLTGEAVDCNDVDRSLCGWLFENIDRLINLGLYIESPSYTLRWIHLQIRIPASGNRFFIP